VTGGPVKSSVFLQPKGTMRFGLESYLPKLVDLGAVRVVPDATTLINPIVCGQLHPAQRESKPTQQPPPPKTQSPPQTQPPSAAMAFDTTPMLPPPTSISLARAAPRSQPHPAH
jgi:hypothetical protein